MKVEIYNPAAPEEPTLRLRLIRHGISGVMLAAVASNGDRLMAGAIATITQEGILVLHPGINGDLGLKLDDEYRILTRMD